MVLSNRQAEGKTVLTDIVCANQLSMGDMGGKYGCDQNSRGHKRDARDNRRFVNSHYYFLLLDDYTRQQTITGDNSTNMKNQKNIFL